MLVRADAIPVLDMIAKAEELDAGAAALWVHLALFDALNEEIAKSRPEIDRVWKSVVTERSTIGRRALVRKAIARRIDGGEIDDIVRAGAGLSLVRGYVAKVEGDDDDHAVVTPDDPDTPEYDARDRRGRFATAGRQKTGSQNTAYDALSSLTERDDRLSGASRSVATELTGDRYQRMRVMGNALVATGNSNLATAGGVARVAAEVGPSAEQVLGPHLRRVAYRYRGTEKRPDRQLLRETKEAQAYIAGAMGTPRSDQERAYQANLSQQLERRAPGEWGKGAVAYQLAQGERKGYTEDQVEMRATGDVAIAHLSRGLPTVDQAFLSQEAGRTPPSIGVMIDRDGDVVSESQGFQGDHFVPFDLKNLKRLNGGSYVRTRALGGPTSEDIYTGLLGGARQMQVVSRSGVFTVEFDPDLRGGRRYSDKAKQMVDRYSRILDRIEQSQHSTDDALYTQDVPKERQSELYAEAAGLSDYDPDETKVRFDRAMARERAQLSLGLSDEELRDEADTQLEEWVHHQQRGGTAPSRTEVGRMREQILGEVREHAMADKQAQQVRRLKLDAEGYYRALQSLQKEFPFFIRDVDYESLRDFELRRGVRGRGEPLSPRGAPDARRAHVERGALMPAKQAGLYGLTPQGQRKPPKEAGSTDDADESGAAARRKPGGDDGSGGAGATMSFSDKVREPEHLAKVNEAVDTLRATTLINDEQAGLDPLADANGVFPNREAALDTVNAKTYLKYLASSSNRETNGTTQGIAKFITEQATERELNRMALGLQQFAGMNLTAPPSPESLTPEKIKPVLDTIRRTAFLRFPFADAEGDPALHEPDLENPKPRTFAGITDIDVDDPKALDKARSAFIKSNPQADSALTWAAEAPSEQDLGKELHDQVVEFKAAETYGKKRLAAHEAGREAPPKPQSLKVSSKDTEDIAANPKGSPQYRQLLARQQAYALRRMEALFKAGDSGPKGRLAIEGSKSARLGSRRVVWHDPDDPLSQALAKRLSRRASTRRATPRSGR